MEPATPIRATIWPQKCGEGSAICFGNQTTTQQSQASPYVQSAAQSNVNYATNLENNGFTPYSGQQVASFSPQQASSFTMGSNVANAGTANLPASSGALGQAISTASNAPTVNSESIASQMSPYMNQYVSLALQPQLQAQQNQQAINQQLTQGQATSAGAFGDPRATMIQQNQQLNNNLANESLIGNAYNAAFNTAIGAGAQDVANNLTAQQANAGIWSNQINNLLGASNTGFNQATQGTNLQNTLGSQQTAQSQAELNAAYNQWQLAQQYPFQTISALNSAIGSASPTNMTTTSTAPNNSGWGILGSLLGAGGSALSGGGLGALLGAGGMLAGNGGMNATPNMSLPDDTVYAAEGGNTDEEQPTVVGERGPELFVPKSAGSVVTYEQLQKAMKNKQGVKVPSHKASNVPTLPPTFGIAA